MNKFMSLVAAVALAVVPALAQEAQITHKGKVQGDTITGTAELGDMGSMN